MALILYKKQMELLEFLKQYMEMYGAAPTLRQIAEALNVSSLATVHEHLIALENKGVIKRTKGASRSIEFTDSEVNANPQGVTVPIMGIIAAGLPIQTYTDPNATISIPPTFFDNSKRTYVLKVRGDSMIKDGIHDGDFVVVQATDTAVNGEIVVAMLDTGMATLKRFFKEATRIRLEPANDTMKPIFVKSLRIQGKVVGLIRHYSSSLA